MTFSAAPVLRFAYNKAGLGILGGVFTAKNHERVDPKSMIVATICITCASDYSESDAL